MLDLSPEFAWLRREVDVFVSFLMGNYLTEIDEGSVKQKVLRDAVWGNIRLTGSEIIILDSPIVQRLRGIGNLGLASLIFPGATHSRFEHTLGVTHVAGQIATSIIPLVEGDFSDLPIDPVSLTRIAALFHDTGHIFCSHAGEKYFGGHRYSRATALSAALTAFAKRWNLPSTALGEMLSALIITSRPAVKLIEIALGRKISDRQGGTSVAKLAAEMILGISSRQALWPFAAIINGPLDADKCDYLARDAMQTGVPVLVDLDRLTDKFVPIHLPGSEPSAGQRLGIHISALTNVEELSLSRCLMYDKVYHHPKVQTAETMLFEALDRIEQAAPGFFGRFDHILRLADCDLIHWEARDILVDWARRLSVPIVDEKTFLSAGKLLEDIARRDLFFRTVELPTGYCTGQPLDAAQRLAEAVRTELRTIEAADADPLPATEVRLLIMPTQGISQTVPDIWLDEDYQRVPYVERADIAPHIERRRTDWVIAAKKSAASSVLATETVLWRDHGIALGRRCWRHLKAPLAKIETLRTRLINKGYYRAFPGLLPLPVDFLPRIEALALKFSANLPADRLMTSEEIGAFVAQCDLFEMPIDRASRIDAVIAVLEAIMIVDESELTAGLIEAFDRLPLPIRAARQSPINLNRTAPPRTGLGLSPSMPIEELPNLLDAGVDFIVFLEEAKLSDADLVDRIRRLIIEGELTGSLRLSPSQCDSLTQIPCWIVATHRGGDGDNLAVELDNLPAKLTVVAARPSLARLTDRLSAERMAVFSRLREALSMAAKTPKDRALWGDDSRENGLLLGGVITSEAPALLWHNGPLTSGKVWRALLPRKIRG